MFHVEALNDHIKVEPFITWSHYWSGQSAGIVTSEEGWGLGVWEQRCWCVTPPPHTDGLISESEIKIENIYQSLNRGHSNN